MRTVLAAAGGLVLGALVASAAYEWRQREEASAPKEESTPPAAPRGHLEPCSGTPWDDSFVEYALSVRDDLGLSPRTEGELRFRMLAYSGLQAEYAVSLVHESIGTSRVQVTEAKEGIASERGFLQGGPWPGPIPIDLASTAISADLSTRVRDAFRPYLFDTRYPDGFTGGLDGTTYVFTAFVPGRGILCGEIWSPGAGTAGSDLVALGEALRAAAHAQPNDAAKMEAAIAQAVDRLAAQAPPVTQRQLVEE